MASKELITKIILKGDVDSSLTKALSTVAKHSDTALNKLKGYGEKAASAFKFTAAAVASSAAYAAKAAIDYESAFAGVMKTVEETDTTKYEDLSKGIRELAKTTPATTTEIAAVAEAAGQLGIKADDILTFSKTMIDLGETTNLTSEEAATAIAKMFNITGTSMGQVDRFGATLVALGNNAATTESDILNMASRIASSASQVGMTEQELLALATSLSSVGLEAEGGGTAISTVMSQIDKSVALNKESLATWASTAGMSVSSFSTLWEKDAYGAMQKVIQGMGDTKTSGGNLNVLLEDLGITGIRTSDTMKRLSNASGLMSDMTNLANTAWSENTALTTEANTRYGTLASKIQIAKNKLNDVAITVGNALMPVIQSLLDKMDEINWDAVAEKLVSKIQWVIDNFDKIKVVLGILGTAFAAFKIAGFINTMSQAVKEINNIKEALGIVTKLDKMKSALMGLPKVQGAVSAAQKLMNLTFMGCPVVWIVAAIAALVAAFIYLWNNCEGFRNFWIGLWEKIKSIASTVGDWLKNFFTVTIPTAFNNFVEKCKSVGNSIKTFFTTTIPNAFNTVVTFFAELPGKIWTWLVGVGQKIATWGSNLWAKAKEIGANFVNGIVNFFQQLPYKIGYVIGFVIGKIIQFGQKLWNFATVTVPQFIGKVVDWFAQLPGKIWTWLVNTATKIKTWGANIIAVGKAKAKAFLTAVVNLIKTLPGKIWNWLVKTANKIKEWGENIISVGKEKAKLFLTAVVNLIKTLPGKVWTWLKNTVQKVVQWGKDMVSKAKKAATDTFNGIVNIIKKLPGKMLSIGRDIVEGLWNGIKNAKDWLIGKIKSFANGITDGIKDALGISSPSKVMEKVFRWVPIGAGNGIMDNAKYAINAVKSMGGKITAAASRINPAISTNLPKFGTGGTVTTPQAAIVGDRAETIVPHGNTHRNRSLLAEAARGVGVPAGGNIINFTFAPVISGGNAEENKAMIRDEEEEFERKMTAWLEKNRRLAYGV